MILHGITFCAISNWKPSSAFSKLRIFWLAITNSWAIFSYSLISFGCFENFASISFFCSAKVLNLPLFKFNAVSTAVSCFLSSIGWICANLNLRPLITFEEGVNFDVAFANSFSILINSKSKPWSKSPTVSPSPISSLKPLAVRLPLMISSRTLPNFFLSDFKKIISSSIFFFLFFYFFNFDRRFY